MWWRELALVGLSVGAWLGCSSNDAAQGGPQGAGRGGQAGTAANGGTGASAAFGTGGTDVGGTGGGSTNGGGGTAGVIAIEPLPAGWTCMVEAYGDGKCDCGCGVADKDCTDTGVAACDTCNGLGSCNLAACPGRIDPSNVATCTPPPASWTCTPARYGDGSSCDCGCGAADPDCAGAKVSSCDSCTAPGSCAKSPCPSSIAADDNTRCEVPPGWTCDPTTYGDGTCNCGCGIVDVDCPDAEASSCEVCDNTSCWPLHCDHLSADDNAHCSAPPPAWNCSARLYHDGTRCDCGCGAIDPDCATADVDACDKCDSPGSCSAQPCPNTIDPVANGTCDQPPPPAGWTCPASAYADGIACDCGCGVPDLDCKDSNFTTCERCDTCGGHGECEGTVDMTDTTQCAPPPAGWICSADEWRDAVCDCGCGIPDVYCQSIELAYVCGNYPVDGCTAGNKTHIDPDHNERCIVNVPSAWTCDPAFYDDGFCDCGCGALDLDCPADDATDCEQCSDDGSCSTTACPGTIAPTDTAHCTK
ncbi:MAG TPA: hypothetical protein VMI54_17560 [Polyangiaceae bacterium]|nr:hypothetical protein [Polyangiaceae bacterium]